MVNPVSALPQWSRNWAEMRLQQHQAAGNTVTSLQWTDLNEWLTGLPSTRPKMPGKIHKLTLMQAIRAAEGAGVEERRIISRFSGNPDAFEYVCSASEPGWRWVRVITPEGFDYEGSAMNNCMGNGEYDDDISNSVFSLRDSKNIPHCTIEWDEQFRTVIQVQGKGNRGVTVRIHALVADFIKNLSPFMVEYAGKFDHAFINGKLLPCRMIPEGTNAEGSLDLSYCSLKQLPENLTVERNLIMYQCRSLVTVPASLQVGGEISFRDCISLQYLPSNFTVNGNLNLTGCVSLEKLPTGLRVHKGLWISGCNSMRELPNDMQAGFRYPQ